MDETELAAVLKVLSVETRLRILTMLEDGPLCVNALASRLGVTAAAVSQHLRILRDAGAVNHRRRGNHVHYSLDERTLARWKSLLDELLASAANPREGCCSDELCKD
ncbi:metalloregulator ArsR/SmtB family transcription factor [Candidatus Fermentibacteria bacterium]|nr:metalloregulator ArsR/SmtB family transcription factor [Candidatus Fermentibacteria bacterium]